MLDEEEMGRYRRQISLFGSEGQGRLKRSEAFVAGAGGLGSVVSLYMVAAGFGRVRLVDRDVVELSNLNRQILHGTSDLGRRKADSSLDTLGEINPDVELEAVWGTLDEETVSDLVGDADLIVDAMDNFDVRYLLNRAAQEMGIPLFHGAISGFRGQATTVIPGRTACLRCVFPKPPGQGTFPALGSTCGVIGSIQVTEAVKYVVGKGDLLENRLLLWDGATSTFDELPVERDPGCPDCGRG